MKTSSVGPGTTHPSCDVSRRRPGTRVAQGEAWNSKLGLAHRAPREDAQRLEQVLEQAARRRGDEHFSRHAGLQLELWMACQFARVDLDLRDVPGALTGGVGHRVGR